MWGALSVLFLSLPVYDFSSHEHVEPSPSSLPYSLKIFDENDPSPSPFPPLVWGFEDVQTLENVYRYSDLVEH